MANDVLRRVLRRVANLLIRAVAVRDDDGPAMQLVQVRGRTGEVKDALEHWQPYGFTFRVLPPSANGFGPETVVLAIEPDLRIALPAADRRHRPAGLLQPGEVLVYDDQGQVVHLKRNGIVVAGKNILLKSDGVIRIDGAKVEIHGRTYVQTDVHGKGSRETWTGGVNYDTDSYTTGATGGATEHGLDQPDIPTDHPEP